MWTGTPTDEDRSYFAPPKPLKQVSVRDRELFIWLVPILLLLVSGAGLLFLINLLFGL